MKQSFYSILSKAIATLILCLLTVAKAKADVSISSANFPDATFRNYVSANFDLDGNGQLSDEEIGKVKRMDVQQMGIKSLKGIEYFTAMTVLNCYGNEMTELDLSKNTKLRAADIVLSPQQADKFRCLKMSGPK